MDFKKSYDEYISTIERSLDEYMKVSKTPEKNIYEAMRYSVMAGGKRLRPVLALAVCDMLGGSREEVLPFACAIEMIHTYSLIHDDLPAMDNDDFRRGRPTNHKVFGEAMAVLAGDALLNKAFEMMLKHTITINRDLKKMTDAMHVIAEASGTSGMIGGQVVDIEQEGRSVSPDILEYMHLCKTGALIKAPLLSAAILSGATEKQFEDIKLYGEKIGLAFQVKDDILDVEGNSELMGKSTGSDSVNEKSTFVTLYGMENAREKLSTLVDEAIKSLEVFGERSWFLKEIAEYIQYRSK